MTLIRRILQTVFAVLAMAALSATANAGTLTNVSLSVANPTVGANSNITITYTTATALQANDQLILAQLPAGFALVNSFIPGFCGTNMTLTLNGTPTSIEGGGINSPTCGTFFGTGLQINTGIPIPAGTVVSITIRSAIAQNPPSAGVKTMTAMQTSTQVGVAIDTPATLPNVAIVSGSAPAVTAISPASGPSAGGTAVTITGTGFTGATAVLFGGANATSFTVNSDTSITATSPAGAAGEVDVVVTTLAGSSVAGPASRFTYAASSGNVSAIPTLGEWGLIALGLMLAVLGSVLLRRSPALNRG